VLAALQPHQPLSVDASTREDQAEGRRFLEGRGFGLASRAPASQLNPASFDPGPYAQTAERLADEGVAIQTLAELAASDPGYLRKLYDLECEAAQDLPWHDRFTPQPYEQYILSYRDNPDLMPDGYMVALERGQVVGMTQLWRSQATDAILYTGLTAVRRTHRRRGIATAIKAQAIGYAKTLVTSQGGPPMIRTENEESNPMFRLNLRLGFRERPAWLVYRKEL
jgi:GNAT superfamily N-acetyltransferase